jgi:hypothetical protein
MVFPRAWLGSDTVKHSGHKLDNAVCAISFKRDPAQLNCLSKGKSGEQNYQACGYTQSNTMP